MVPLLFEDKLTIKVRAIYTNCFFRDIVIAGTPTILKDELAITDVPALKPDTPAITDGLKQGYSPHPFGLLNSDSDTM